MRISDKKMKEIIKKELKSLHVEADEILSIVVASINMAKSKYNKK